MEETKIFKYMLLHAIFATELNEYEQKNWNKKKCLKPYTHYKSNSIDVLHRRREKKNPEKYLICNGECVCLCMLFHCMNVDLISQPFIFIRFPHAAIAN